MEIVSPDPEHKYHLSHKILLPMELEQHAGSAFKNSLYHFNKVCDLLKTPGMQNQSEENEDIRLFHIYLRAFFWELVSTFDTLLQWANYRYELKIEEGEVNWRNIVDKAEQASKDQVDWDKKYLLFQKAYNSEWYFEAKGYRNFAHRAAFLNNHAVMIADRLKDIFLVHVREGQTYLPIEEQLRYYLENMQELGLKLFELQINNL